MSTLQSRRRLAWLSYRPLAVKLGAALAVMAFVGVLAVIDAGGTQYYGFNEE